MKAKRMLATLMAGLMVTGLMGCRAAETEKEQEQSSTPNVEKTESQEVSEENVEPVTLEWWYYGNGIQEDTEQVEKAFNELLQTYPEMEHVTVNLNCHTASEYKNAVILAQAADQQMDILHTFNLDFAEEVGKGTFLALDDLLAENEALKNELPDWLWDMGSIDGSTYIVPNYQRAANMMYFITPKEYMDKYGDLDEMRTLIQDENRTVESIAKMCEEYCVAVQAGEGATKYMPSIGGLWPSSWGFAPMYDSLYGTFIKFAGEKNVQNQGMTEDVYKAYGIAAEWYEKGYVHPDVLTIDSNAELNGANMLNEVSNIFCVNNQAGDEETVSAYYSSVYGFDVYAIPVFTNYYITNTWPAGGNGITASCENPEEALRLIELMTTEEGKDLYNMIVYGLEGVHYEKIDDTHIKTLEYNGSQGGIDSSYAAMKWIMGNTMHSYLNQGCVEGENELARAINENPDNVISDLMGFNTDISKISTQLEQTTATFNEYYNTLSNGVMGDDWEAFYDEFEEKMNAAGLQEILDELQSQLDAFYAK